MRLLLTLLCCCAPLVFGEPVEVRVNFAQTNGLMRMNQMALGQGGLSDEVM